MKKFFIGSINVLFISALLLSNVLLIASSKVSAMEGDGGQETPFRIETCQDLQDIRNDLDAYYVLANDIDCSGFTGFEPIGDDSNHFIGELDGQGFAVSNLTVDPTDDFQDNVGLFGQIGEWDNQVGLVKDFGLEMTTIVGDWSTGGIAGELYGQINNVYVTGSVTGRGEVGGLVGSHGGVWDTIINSYSTADVIGTGDAVGGLAGYNAENSQIINSYATGDVAGDDSVGGLVGVNNGNIEGSHATGLVDADNNVGGLVGYNDSTATVTRSYATGHVDGNSDVGGFIGENLGTVNRSYSNNTNGGGNNVGVDGNCSLGGFIGRNSSSNRVENNFSRSSSNSSGTCGTGGFVGTNNSGEIIWNYSTGTATGGPDETSWAGFAGLTDVDTNLASAYDNQTSGHTVGCGTDSPVDCSGAVEVVGRTTADMKLQSTFVGDMGEGAWDFVNIWGLDPQINDGYPYLIGTIGATQTPQPENETPNQDEEDLNGDGIDDSSQPNVGGYVSSYTGKLVAIDVGEDCELTVDDMTRESQLDVQDAVYDYDNGLWAFEAECAEGATTTVKLYYYNVDPNGLVLRKHNDLTGAYFTVNGAVVSSQIINGNSVAVVTYQITDNGDLDLEKEDPGMIRDPAGLARSLVGAPNTGLKPL
jgi:hypothetical protein